MKIFLSHSSRDKALVREIKSYLPNFLDTWLDEEELCWGDRFEKTIERVIESEIDFVIIFLGKDALKSDWVIKEIEWAQKKEENLKRIFLLPILIEFLPVKELPACLSNRLQLKLTNQERSSVKNLADKINDKLYQLIIEQYSNSWNNFSVNSQPLGRVSVYPNHKNLTKREDRLENNLQKELRIFSTTADNYFASTDMYPIIDKKLALGCKIRVLLLDPNTHFFKDREKQESSLLKDRQDLSILGFTKLKEIYPNQLALRFFNFAPTYQALIIDDSEIVIALSCYNNRGTIEFPCLEIVNDQNTFQLFKKFTKAFEDAWTNSKDYFKM